MKTQLRPYKVYLNRLIEGYHRGGEAQPRKAGGVLIKYILRPTEVLIKT